MPMHIRFDPHHPMRQLIARIDPNTLSDDVSEAAIAAALPQPFRKMFQEFRRSAHGSAQPTSERFSKLYQELGRCGPNRGRSGRRTRALWLVSCQATGSHFCQLVGYVVGHPQFGHGSPLVTSTVFRIARDHRWARSWSRFYLLNDHDPATFEKMRAAGLLNPDVEPIAFDGSPSNHARNS
jgi:hypothetical protein